MKEIACFNKEDHSTFSLSIHQTNLLNLQLTTQNAGGIDIYLKTYLNKEYKKIFCICIKFQARYEIKKPYIFIIPEIKGG